MNHTTTGCSLVGETSQPPKTGEREPVNVSPEAKKALRALLWEPELRGVGYSEFILRAVEAARGQLESHRAYVERRRRLVRSFNGKMSDEEADALLAKLDAAATAPPAPGGGRE